MTFDVVVLGFNGMMSSSSSVTVGVDVTGGVVVIASVVEVVTVVVVVEDVVTVVEVVVTVTVFVVEVEVDVVEVIISFFADRGLKFKMLFSVILTAESMILGL